MILQAAVAQAQTLLVRETRESELARREWEKYGEGEPNPLVLREPQLAEAEAAVKSAEATRYQRCVGAPGGTVSNTEKGRLPFASLSGKTSMFVKAVI